jgi:hypothetical protein
LRRYYCAALGGDSDVAAAAVAVDVVESVAVDAAVDAAVGFED